MAQIYSFSIPNSEAFIEVSTVTPVVDMLLDERHLSRSALRALDVLDYLSQRQQPARAIDVARALELSPSTADQLLKTMVSKAYLTLDIDHKRYWLAPRLLGLAMALNHAYYGGNRLRMLMVELSEETGCSVAISTPFGRHMQLLDMVAPIDRPYDEMAGHVFPLFSSAAGTAMLSTWPIATVRALIEQCRDQLGPLAENSDAILEHLAEVWAYGHAFGGLSANAKKCSIAFPLPRTASGVELALSVRGTIEVLGERRWRLAARVPEIIADRLAAPCRG